MTIAFWEGNSASEDQGGENWGGNPNSCLQTGGTGLAEIDSL